VKIESKATPEKISPVPTRHVCNLAIRLTNGQTLKAIFSPSDTMADVRRCINQNRTDGKFKYALMTTHPKKVFPPEEDHVSLLQLDLVPSATLVLVSLEPNAKPLPPPATQTHTNPLSTSTTTSSPPVPSGSGSGSGGGGILSGISNYVWGFFGGGDTSAQDSKQNSGSVWEHKYNPKLEQAIRSGNPGNVPPQEPKTDPPSTGMRNRTHNRGNVHSLREGGTQQDDEDKDNAYWNGNSTQFK